MQGHSLDPRWQQLAETLEGNTEPTPELADLTAYRIRSTSPEGGFRAGESWFLSPCLCPEEAQALVASLSYPNRRHGDLFPLPKNQLEILPTPLSEVLADAESRQDLLDRLQSLTPYRNQALPEGGEWVWYFQVQEHWQLWLHAGQLHFPPEWAVDRSIGRIGPLESERGYFPVRNGSGLTGLANIDGQMLLPCRYRWVGHVGFRQALLEAQEANNPPEESDLIDLSGRRLNLPGFKLLAGSFDTDDQPVVVREGTGESGLKGLMDTAGGLLGDIRWRWIKAINEGLAAVQDDDSGLWGYVDACGQPAISCQFHEAHTFNDQRAYASLQPAPSETPRFGLIDRQGEWAIAPVWKDISHLRHDYIVEDFAGRYAVFDRDGHLLLEPRMLTEPEKSEEYAAFIADLTIQIMLEERQKQLLFVPGNTYAANSSPQSSFGRLLVEKCRQNWNDAMNDLIGMLTRRGWLADALSPGGARIPMSMEADKGMPLIGYIWPLLNQRDASICEVERSQAARCYATVLREINQTDRVTVTHVVDHMAHVPATTGGPRIGGLPGRSQREHKVFCVTLRGVHCTVNPEEYTVYRTGQRITAEISLMKPAGEFGWTFLSKFFIWPTLLAFGLTAWRWRKYGSQNE